MVGQDMVLGVGIWEVVHLSWQVLLIRKKCKHRARVARGQGAMFTKVESQRIFGHTIPHNQIQGQGAHAEFDQAEDAQQIYVCACYR